MARGEAQPSTPPAMALRALTPEQLEWLEICLELRRTNPPAFDALLALVRALRPTAR